MYNISILDSWKFGWEVFKKNWSVLIYSVIAPIVIGLFVNEVFNGIPSLHKALDDGGFKKWNSIELYVIGLLALYYVIKYLMAVLFRMGKTLINLDAVDGLTPKYYDLFNSRGVYLNYLLASILFDLCVLGGLIFFIIPGIYIFLTYCFAPVLILDKNMSVADSFAMSKSMTAGRKMSFLWFSVATAFFAVLGVLALGIGMLITFTISEIVFFHVYRRLTEVQNVDVVVSQEELDFDENDD